jgi:hypothetical protein
VSETEPAEMEPELERLLALASTVKEVEAELEPAMVTGVAEELVSVTLTAPPEELRVREEAEVSATETPVAPEAVREAVLRLLAPIPVEVTEPASEVSAMELEAVSPLFKVTLPAVDSSEMLAEEMLESPASVMLSWERTETVPLVPELLTAAPMVTPLVLEVREMVDPLEESASPALTFRAPP